MATAAPKAEQATGQVIQITGPVVDIEFPAGHLPAIYNAVEIERKGQDPLTCEVQQHLGNSWVRAVAMTTTDGLARGVRVRDTGGPISVPGGNSMSTTGPVIWITLPVAVGAAVAMGVQCLLCVARSAWA